MSNVNPYTIIVQDLTIIVFAFIVIADTQHWGLRFLLLGLIVLNAISALLQIAVLCGR